MSLLKFLKSLVEFGVGLRSPGLMPSQGFGGLGTTFLPVLEAVCNSCSYSKHDNLLLQTRDAWL
jgi:hypothetical protein